MRTSTMAPDEMLFQLLWLMPINKYILLNNNVWFSVWLMEQTVYTKGQLFPEFRKILPKYLTNLDFGLNPFTFSNGARATSSEVVKGKKMWQLHFP